MIPRASDIRLFFHQIRLKGFFHLLSANLMTQVFAFASQLFVAGILIPDDIGRIKIIQTFLAVFSIVAGMGLNASTLKICSEGRPEAINKQYFNTAFFFTIVSSAILYLLLLILNQFELLSKDTIIKAMLPLGLFPLISNSIFILLIVYFQAGKNIRLISTLTVINKLLSISGIIVLTYYMGIKGYYIAYNISFVIMIAIGILVAGDLVNKQLFKPDKSLFKHHWTYAKPSMWTNIVSEASSYVDIMIISFFLSSDMEQVGYYSFALTMTIALRIFPSTVQQITLPFFSGQSRRKNDFIRLYQRYNKLLHIVVVGSLLIFLLLSPLLLEWFFGTKFKASLPYLYILAIGWSIRQLIQLRSSAIFGMGKIEYNGYTSLVVFLFNIIAYPVMIYWFGFMGAAYTSILSGLVVYSASLFYFRRAVQKTQWED
jgi:O-antigen/teichoic acid export membrane protein